MARNSSFDRRFFLKLAGGTVAYMVGGSLVYGAELPAGVKKSIAAQLAAQLPPLDGVFVFDDAVCRAMGTDFGHYIHHNPIGVLFPKSKRDIEKIVKYAAAQNLKVAMRGHGCSAYGQAQVDSGIVIDTSEFKDINWTYPGCFDCITTQPGATWYDVVNFTLPENMTPLVLPDTLFLTVGGTLSVGGFGETSYRSGAMVDHVISLEVVTSSGRRKHCSPTTNSDLFHSMLAGMGQCGFIISACIRLESAPPNVVTREFQYSDPSDFLKDLELIARAEPAGAIVGRLAKNPDKSWSYLIDATTWIEGSSETQPPSWLNQISGKATAAPKTLSYSDYVNRNTKSYLDSVKNGSILVPHAYMSFFLPADKTGGMINYLATDQDAGFGAVSIPVFPMVTANFKQELQRIPSGDFAYHIRIYRKAQVEGSTDHQKMIKLNTETFVPMILNQGGTVYPPHAPVLTAAQWQQHYGQVIWSKFSAAKKNFDPEGLLTPGAGIF